MLSPTLISLPFKIMLFVVVDGWTLLIGTLAGAFINDARERDGSRALHAHGHGDDGGPLLLTALVTGLVIACCRRDTDQRGHLSFNTEAPGIGARVVRQRARGFCAR